MSQAQILKLAKKLKALADRGVGGERNNAVSMLQRYMRKHSLTFDDLSEENREKRNFRYKNRFHKRVLIQSIVMVMGKDVVMRGYRGKSRTSNMINVECTQAEYLEIEITHTFYYKHWQKELDYFMDAFIAKNNMYAPDGETREYTDLTPKELERLMKIMEYSGAIERKTLRKSLTK